MCDVLGGSSYDSIDPFRLTVAPQTAPLRLAEALKDVPLVT